MRVIRELYPDYASLTIHESSPGGRGVSTKLRAECDGYSSSQLFRDVAPGAVHPEHGERCEDLESLTFPDASFDLFVTQDVMEHVLEPARAFREIARVLRPGGAHVFTAPLVNKGRPSVKRAERDEAGETILHFEPEYHGNPVDPSGSLVTMHWGYDIAAFITETARCPSMIVQIDDIDRGIRAEFIEVVVSYRR
jgi:SAM-dependent methyltransferase